MQDKASVTAGAYKSKSKSKSTEDLGSYDVWTHDNKKKNWNLQPNFLSVFVALRGIYNDNKQRDSCGNMIQVWLLRQITIKGGKQNLNDFKKNVLST